MADWGETGVHLGPEGGLQGVEGTAAVVIRPCHQGSQQSRTPHREAEVQEARSRTWGPALRRAGGRKVVKTGAEKQQGSETEQNKSAFFLSLLPVSSFPYANHFYLKKKLFLALKTLNISKLV